MYLTAKQAAIKWGISDRRVRILCAENRAQGAYRDGRAWLIPEEVNKPEDGRYKTSKSLFSVIDEKKALLETLRPLTEGETQRLHEQFTIELPITQTLSKATR